MPMKLVLCPVFSEGKRPVAESLLPLRRIRDDNRNPLPAGRMLCIARIVPADTADLILPVAEARVTERLPSKRIDRQPAQLQLLHAVGKVTALLLILQNCRVNGKYL